MRTRRAFTLVELMVTIGIIALLASIVLVVSFKAMGAGRRVRAQADLQAISTALEAYKMDFGDYPRAFGMTDDAFDGAWVLARSIVAPGPEISGRLLTADGADGPGFRVRPGGQGKVYGPYVDTGKIDVRTVDVAVSPNPIRYYLVDKVFAPAVPLHPPILYIPRTTRSITPAEGYVGSVIGQPQPAGPPVMYNIDNISQWAADANIWPSLGGVAAGTQMRIAMGDKDNDGMIDNGETAAFTGSYILWMAGPDGMFGLSNESGKRDNDTGRYQTDDVTNFDFDSAVTVK